jgi:hypothetical protein
MPDKRGNQKLTPLPALQRCKFMVSARQRREFVKAPDLRRSATCFEKAPNPDGFGKNLASPHHELFR